MTTFCGVLGLIGRNFDDADVKRDQKHWLFKLVNKGEKPSIQVKHKHNLKEFVRRACHCCLNFTADEFFTTDYRKKLAKMKETAEAYLGKLTDAIVTVYVSLRGQA